MSEEVAREGEARRTSDRIVSAISRRLAVARYEAIDQVIEGGLAEAARHIGADAAALIRTAADDSIEFISSWYDPSLGPLPFRTDHKSASYNWVRQRLAVRGAQVIDMREIVARVGPPSAASDVIRFVAVIGTFAGDRAVGVLCFYFRRDITEPQATDLEPLEVLGDIMLGSVNRRDAELALRASERLYRKIVETSGEGIWMVDAEMRVAFANRQIADLLGWTVEELIGRHLSEFVADHARDQIAVCKDRRSRGIAEVTESTYLRRDGTPVTVRLAASPLVDEQGRFSGALAMVQDVTEERRLQAELTAARRLEAIGPLAGGVAHDINNALTVVMFNAEKGERAASGALRGLFSEITAAGERASGVARQLLAFARRESLQPRTIEVPAVVDQLLPMISQLVGAHITLSTRFAPNVWPVLADPVQLERVLLNLAANARDAMPDGGTLSIEIGNSEVDGSCGRVARGDYVTVAVRDSGHGMTEEVLARVFEPFFTTKDQTGTGLGLASAYGAMQQLGGGIGITSTVGAGTCVTLYCPRSPGTVERHRVEALRTVARGTHRVLYVEDLEPLRNVIRATLADAGYDVLVASDGEEAARIAEGDAGTIDALVTDVVMPRMNGYRLAEHVRIARPTLRVLYLSGYDRPQGLEAALGAANTAFLAKPFSTEALLARLDLLLRADILDPDA